jgi:hypothetical protein
MKLLRTIPVLAAVLLLLTSHRAAAQAQSAAPQLPGCFRGCYSVVLPYGLYVREVTDGGSFVTLEDGSVWEIRLPQRPVASSWQPGDFVVLRTIPAPVQNYDILLTHGDYDRADARLAGRAHPPNQE